MPMRATGPSIGASPGAYPHRCTLTQVEWPAHAGVSARCPASAVSPTVRGVLLDQVIAVDALAVVALAAAIVVHGQHVSRRAAEARRTLLRQFATGELDLSGYERAVAALEAGLAIGAGAPLPGRLSIGDSPSR